MILTGHMPYMEDMKKAPESALINLFRPYNYL